MSKYSLYDGYSLYDDLLPSAGRDDRNTWSQFSKAHRILLLLTDLKGSFIGYIYWFNMMVNLYFLRSSWGINNAHLWVYLMAFLESLLKRDLSQCEQHTLLSEGQKEKVITAL